MSPNNPFMNAYMKFHQRHERVKKFVHEGFRYPLPSWGRFAMGCFYFSMPVVAGWNVMQWAISKSHEEIGEKGEKLRIKHIEGIGDKMVDGNAGEARKVGAGGWGGGVNLAVSDEETQKRNQKMLRKFLKQQRKRMNKEDNKAKESEGEGKESSK